MENIMQQINELRDNTDLEKLDELHEMFVESKKRFNEWLVTIRDKIDPSLLHIIDNRK